MMKKGVNYVLAALVFIITMLLISGSGFLLSFGAALFGVMAGGPDGPDMVYEYLMDNMNLYSCLIYMIPGIVFLLWYYFAFVEPVGTGRFAAAQTKRLTPSCFLWLVPLTFAVQHAISLLMAMVAMLMPSAMENYTEMVETSGLSEYSPVWVIATLILPSLVEETIFRGLIFQYLRKAGACFVVANLIQAVLFGVFHMNLIQGIYTAFFGFLLGYLAWRYESLLVPMAMHALFNFFGTVVISLESRFLPEILLGLIILGSVPVAAVILVMMHFGIGEGKKNRKRIHQD
ncbi:MAG TPA: CPBP family intramembrane metalloprotease [Candidatus Mediterraneibacter pullistercoris]|nr:CPBP family intramembrane metalloprotease [Candidatus Mediterraneibacter pullistercoris]